VVKRCGSPVTLPSFARTGSAQIWVFPSALAVVSASRAVPSVPRATEGCASAPEAIVSTSLAPNINSAFADDNPAISKDGLSLYFQSGRPGGYGGLDIYVAHRITTSQILTSWNPLTSWMCQIEATDLPPNTATVVDPIRHYFSTNTAVPLTATMSIPCCCGRGPRSRVDRDDGVGAQLRSALLHLRRRDFARFVGRAFVCSRPARSSP